LSRTPLALLLALATAPVPAPAEQVEPPVTAEQAIANYREVFEPTRELDCPRSDDPEEIVVCGRRSDAPDPDRAPLPIGPEPGTRIVGDVPNGVASMNADSCLRLCPQPVMIDVYKAAKFMKNLAERLIEGE